MLISEVVFFHLLFEAENECLVEPLFGVFALICLVNHILVLVLDVLRYIVLAFEMLAAESTLILLSCLDFLAFVLAKFFDIIQDEFL